MNKNWENTINTGSVKFRKINSIEARKNIYKKITKKDFVFALTFSFLFAFGIFWFQNAKNFKADLFDTPEQVIYDWEKDRTFNPTLSFYPENSVINNWTTCDSYNISTDDAWVENKECVWKTHYEYYVSDTPNDTIEISLDNVVSDPTCSYWWKYKFQWTTEYIKLWETINESSTSVYWVNHPLLSKQEWINANYKIDETWTWVTIYFDKDIKNWKYYDFALDDWITFYENYKTLDVFDTWNRAYEIKWNELRIAFPNEFKTDFWRIVINENLISDLDWRINDQKSVVWKKIWNEIVIDNKIPVCKTVFTWSLIATISCSENIIEDENITSKININWKTIDNLNTNWKISELWVEWNLIKITFLESISWDLVIWTWAVIDKAWNINNEKDLWDINISE